MLHRLAVATLLLAGLAPGASIHSGSFNFHFGVTALSWHSISWDGGGMSAFGLGGAEFNLTNCYPVASECLLDFSQRLDGTGWGSGPSVGVTYSLFVYAPTVPGQSTLLGCAPGQECAYQIDWGQVPFSILGTVTSWRVEDHSLIEIVDVYGSGVASALTYYPLDGRVPHIGPKMQYDFVPEASPGQMLIAAVAMFGAARICGRFTRKMVRK